MGITFVTNNFYNYYKYYDNHLLIIITVKPLISVFPYFSRV